LLDIFFILKILPYLAEGLITTFQVSLTSFAIGLALAVLLTPARVLGRLPLSGVARFYIEVIRGTPVLVQLFIIYFGLPSLGMKFDPLTASIIALGLNSAAYQAEILRASIKSIPESQYLSAESLGMSTGQIYRYVVLPQSIRIAVPALVNELVTLVKESSIVSVIGVVELMRKGDYMVASTFRAFEVYLGVAIIYFLVCFLLSQLSKIVEEKLKIPGYERGSQ